MFQKKVHRDTNKQTGTDIHTERYCAEKKETFISKFYPKTNHFIYLSIVNKMMNNIMHFSLKYNILLDIIRCIMYRILFTVHHKIIFAK